MTKLLAQDAATVVSDVSSPNVETTNLSELEKLIFKSPAQSSSRLESPDDLEELIPKVSFGILVLHFFVTSSKVSLVSGLTAVIMHFVRA